MEEKSFIVALFVRAKIWKKTYVLSVDEWVKACRTYTTECYSSIRKKKILPFVTTWMELESMILSETSQAEKDK